MRISIVVAASDNDVIGIEGRLPWHLPDDLKRFKALTLGKPVLMGRKTFESIGRPLPARTNLVLTRRPDFAPAGVRVVRSLPEALAAAAPAAELMVIGGEAVLAEVLPQASRIHLTRVHAHIEGNVHFRIPDTGAWHEVERVEHPADAKHTYAMSFITLERHHAGEAA